MDYNALQYITIHYNTLRFITINYSALQYITIHCNTLKYSITHYDTLHYNTLQYITIHYNTLRYIRTYVHIHLVYIVEIRTNRIRIVGNLLVNRISYGQVCNSWLQGDSCISSRGVPCAPNWATKKAT